VPSPEQLHTPYVGRNRALLELLEHGESEQAAVELEGYLDDSLAGLLAAGVAARTPAPRRERP
jgi:hypothetical protein